jgi:ABC-type uncharacterized transport system fused permease/ATPase subunit
MSVGTITMSVMAPKTWPGVILVLGKKKLVMLVKAVVTRNSSVQPGRRREAYLNGEDAEQNMAGQRFGALIANYLALVYRRMRVTAFTHTFGQISPIIPYIFTAPFYFARKIELGVMTQTAGAFGHVANALTFFVNYYTYLAGFKSVVDRLNSFDMAIDQAEALSKSGPARVARASDTPRIDLEDVDLFLPDGKLIVDTKHLVLAEGENVALSGPSGSGKSTLFRAIAGIWPFGEGRIHIPPGIRVMVVPAKPYIPISTLRAALIRRYPVPIRTTTFAGRLSMPISATSSTNSIARKCGHSGCPVGSSSALH